MPFQKILMMSLASASAMSPRGPTITIRITTPILIPIRNVGLPMLIPLLTKNDNNVQARPHKNQNPSILRSDSASTTSSQRVRFHGVADNSRSTAMAQALGIPPNTLNGMGSVHQRNGSSSSADTRSIYSRTTSIGPISGPFVGGAFNPTMETLMEEVVIGELPDRSSLTPSHEGIRHLREEGWDQGIGFPP